MVEHQYHINLSKLPCKFTFDYRSIELDVEHFCGYAWPEKKACDEILHRLVFGSKFVSKNGAIQNFTGAQMHCACQHFQTLQHVRVVFGFFFPRRLPPTTTTATTTTTTTITNPFLILINPPLIIKNKSETLKFLMSILKGAVLILKGARP